jgi:hypothetical protein
MAECRKGAKGVRIYRCLVVHSGVPVMEESVVEGLNQLGDAGQQWTDRMRWAGSERSKNLKGLWRH